MTTVFWWIIGSVGGILLALAVFGILDTTMELRRLRRSSAERKP